MRLLSTLFLATLGSALILQVTQWQANIGNPLTGMRTPSPLREKMLRFNPGVYTNDGVTYLINSQGYRGPEWELDKDIVLICGDSFVFGIGLENDQTITSHLRGILGDGYEVVNFGLPAHSPLSLLDHLREKVPASSKIASIMLVTYFDDPHNDREYQAQERDRSSSSSLQRVRNWLKEGYSIALLGRLDNRILQPLLIEKHGNPLRNDLNSRFYLSAAASDSESGQTSGYQYDASHRDVFIKSISLLRQFGSEHGTELVVVPTPVPGTGYTTYVDFLSGCQIEFSDIRQNIFDQALRNGNEISEMYLVENGHFSGLGCHYIGQFLANHIEGQPHISRSASPKDR